MHNGKYTSVREIYDRVTRTFDIDEFDPNEAAEYIADALSLLAIPEYYEDKVCLQPIVEHRSELPKDMLFLIQARYKPEADSTDDNYVALRYAGNSFQNGYMCSNSAESYGTNYYGSKGYYSSNPNPDFTYTINANHMHFNTHEGVVQLAYKSFPVDKDGLPMIPDDVFVKRAMEDYVLEKIGKRLYLKDKISTEKFKFLQQESNWSMGAAQERGLTPSVDQMESLKNIWLRLIPSDNPHATYFSNEGQQQRLRYQPDNNNRRFLP